MEHVTAKIKYTLHSHKKKKYTLHEGYQPKRLTRSQPQQTEQVSIIRLIIAHHDPQTTRISEVTKVKLLLHPCLHYCYCFIFFFCCTKWIIMPMDWLKSSSQAVENQPIFSGRPLVPFLLMVNSVLYALHIPLMQLITKPQQNRQV